jgi:predicted protein tyrosine phosphatase
MILDLALQTVCTISSVYSRIRMASYTWRSPTAEQVWRKDPRVLARSTGTSPNARHTISAADIQWADVILVMEEKHKSRIKAEFTRLIINSRKECGFAGHLAVRVKSACCQCALCHH